MLKAAILFCVFVLFPSPSFSQEFGFDMNWFGNFNDDILIQYICKALDNNKDIKIARQNILKYRQEKNLNISEEFPYISVGSDYLLLKVPKLAIPNNDIQTNSYALPFLTIWEIDYLGKKYNKIQKSGFDIENSFLDWKITSLIVAVETAGAYFNISNLNEQIKKQEEIKKLKAEILKHRQKMFEYGVIDIFELNESKQEFLVESNKLENLLNERMSFLSGLKYLIGEAPYELNKMAVTSFDRINYTGSYPDSFKGDIAANRPDIIKIENELKKAKLDVSIAKKDFLPSINIFGLMTFSTFVQNFGWKGALAALSVGAYQTLFDGGRRIFNLKKRKIEYETAFENYLKANMNALKEVNGALYNLKRGYIIYSNDNKRLKIKDETFVRALNLYECGIKSYPDLIEERIERILAQMDFLNSKNNDFINLLTLFKATGGIL